MDYSGAVFSINSAQTRIKFTSSPLPSPAQHSTTAFQEFIQLDGRTLLTERLVAETTAAAAAGTLLPHPSRLVIKCMVRTLFMTNFSEGARATEESTAGLFSAFVRIMDNPATFGAGLFSITLNTVADTINQDPLQFR